MDTLTKLALGMIGRLKLAAPVGESQASIVLPAAQMSGGLPLMDTLHRRHSEREFSATPLEPQLLSNLLWAACGINRHDLGGRTAPSAMNAQEVDVYVALPQGLYLYDPGSHTLKLIVAKDVRRITGYQDFVDSAPVDLIFVADHSRMRLVPSSKRVVFAAIAAGAMTQNISLFCASSGLGCVVRAWFDRNALSQAMGLGTDQQILLTQTIGHPAKPAQPIG